MKLNSLYKSTLQHAYLALLAFMLIAFVAPTSVQAQDFDGDGISDATEGSPSRDTDGDGGPDFEDLDSDNDGILDVFEAQATGSFSLSAPGFGTLTPVDTDGDGIADYLDLDSDNDLTYDYVEAHDSDGDGYPDAGSPAATGVRLSMNDRTDSDGDGILDVYDNNGTGPNDGIPAINQYTLSWRVIADADGDGIADAIDMDSDADGIDNNNDGPTDAISNSSVNIVSTTTEWTSSCPGTAFISQYDGSGGTNFYYYDMEAGQYSDAQNYAGTRLNALAYNPLDGKVWAIRFSGSGNEFYVFDPNDFSTEEATHTYAVDTRYTVQSKAGTVGFIADGGKKYVVGLAWSDYDSDGSNQSGFMIIDIDPTSNTYLEEIDRWVGASARINLDASVHPDGFVYSIDVNRDLLRIDLFGSRAQTNLGNTGTQPGAQWFSPSFGYFYSGANGLVTTIEDVQSFSTFAAMTTNSAGDFNGAVSTGNVDACACARARTISSDGDNFPDYLDIDADNDGITDITEATGTFESTGRPVSTVDSDGDGLDDAFDPHVAAPGTAGTPITILDSDGDGVNDFLDLDSDNDAIPDYIEGVCSECLDAGGGGTEIGMAVRPGNYSLLSSADPNENGLLNVFEALTNGNLSGGTNIGVNPEDTDGTGNPDYLDTDADDDGFMDWTEGFDVTGNFYTYPEIHGRGLAFEANALSPPGIFDTNDFDGDEVYDWLDNDPTNPGFIETSRPPFLDPGNTLGLTTYRVLFADANNNGLIDIYDPFITGGEETPTPRNSGAVGADDDWRNDLRQTPLPIELLSFQAERAGQASLLTWVSETEINSSHYEIERSREGVGFEYLGRVSAAGNTQGEREYTFIDAQPLQGINYYRLRLVDLDGSYTYSEVRAVRFEDLSGQLVLFPNPTTTGELNVRLPQGLSGQELYLDVTDVLGRTVLEATWGLQDGLNRTLNVELLPDGIYYLRMRTATWEAVRGFHKQ